MQWKWRCTFRDAFYVCKLLWPWAHVKMPKIQQVIDVATSGSSGKRSHRHSDSDRSSDDEVNPFFENDMKPIFHLEQQNVVVTMSTIHLIVQYSLS